MYLHAEGGSLATRQFSAMCDYWHFYPGPGVLVVIQGGFGHHDMGDESTALVLGAHAVMGFDELQPLRVYSALIRPRLARHQRVRLADYDLPRLAAARREILGIHGAALQLDAPLAASEDACRGCRARLVCPAFRERVFGLQRFDARPVVERLDSETLGRFADAIKLARSKTFGEVVLAEVSRRIAAGDMPGWTLRETRPVARLTNVSLACRRFYKAFPALTTRDFLGCATFSLGDLRALALRMLGNGLPADEVQRRASALLDGIVSEVPRSSAPVRLPSHREDSPGDDGEPPMDTLSILLASEEEPQPLAV
jgi:hypothetical protein